MTLDDLITAINDETNVVANRIDNLKSELAAALSQGSPVTQAQLDELAAISTRLQGLGADPANPVPAPTTTTPSA